MKTESHHHQKPKVALFYDWLNQWGGAEKVLLDLISLYPDAPVFTLVYDPSKTAWLPSSVKVIPSFINDLPGSKSNPLLYTPLYALAAESFDLSGYDIIISTTSTVGHCLLTGPRQLFVCYYHNVNRYLYQTPPNFRFLSPLLNIYKKVDFIFSRRPDFVFCNSVTVSERIKNVYHRDAQIINPGIDTSFFKPKISKVRGNYYLVVSRLVKHKRIDLAVDACNVTGRNLYIVGSGRETVNINKYLKKINTSKIKLFGQVSQKHLLELYQNCRAVICPQLEDYGIVQIEAQSCGKPVIGFNKGGTTETVLDGITGCLFDEQSVSAIVSCIKKIESNPPSPRNCRTQSLKFSRQSFMLHFNQAIESLWHKTLTTTI